MRVIGGQHRSRVLTALDGKQTRPTTDKVKESIFNMIGPRIDSDCVLDLFAGSGALGIEALSRGAKQAVFIDKNRRAVQVIQKNIHMLNLDQQAVVYTMEATHALQQCALHDMSFDLVFLDPPYAMQTIVQNIEMMQQLNILQSQARIVCEVDKSVMLDDIDGFIRLKEKTYGITKVVIYQRECM